ncbi:MAG: hypothetical protein LC679_07530 [Intrasporangiaceae bacterium]|nr:hypothetical protein [Intrasporangiaceae bacterium]
MRTHSLSRPLIVEPPLSPANPPPEFPCLQCDREDELNSDGVCDECAHLLSLDVNQLTLMVVDLRIDLAFANLQVAKLEHGGVR